MRSPDRFGIVGRFALCVAACVIVAGCSARTNDPAATPTSDPARHAATSASPTADNVVSAAMPDVPSPTPPTTVREARPAATVTVSGGVLPAEIVDGYTVSGGDLVDPAEWTARYGTVGLPELTGPGVRLVEATRAAQRTRDVRDRDVWERVDEAAWLAITTVDRDRLLAEIAAAAGVGGTPTRVSGIDNGGDCVTDTYRSNGHGIVWRLQGCSYPRYPQMVAVGVSRTGPAVEPPVAADSTIAPLAELLGGDVGFLEVRLGPPGADGATLHISAHLELPTTSDVDSASDAVTAALDGPLAGWQVLLGDGSALLSGPTGATWTLADGVAVFDWAGRW